MLKRLAYRLSIILAILGFTVSLNFSRPATAFNMLNRSIILGSNLPSDNTSHNFQFDIPTTVNISSIQFEYCTNSPSFYLSCTAPVGLDVSGANLALQSGNTGFSINTSATTANNLVINRTSSPGSAATNHYDFDNIVNPSTSGQTVYVKISTHDTPDASDPRQDSGAVAFAVQSIFNVDAFVPPFLQMCVGVTVAPNCSSIIGDSIDLGILSSTIANKGQSQYAVATNDISGYVVFALGTTMTSGSNVIPSLGAPTASLPGTGQFGMNLRANLVPTIGQNPVGIGTGVPTSGYNIPNRFTFNDGDSISSSTLPSDYNRMTVSYLVNVPKSQPPGVYSTTITYVATVQF
ncbi:hypothetical protein KW792_00700 [Candidatus Saccharibacteria bacterium]|nr:hypothetical protein [Candidatus Saccharibacteria bacterium]